MGICNGTANKTARKDKNTKLDFEYFRDLVKENINNKVYEVKANLYDIATPHPKITTTVLANKYLFFEPTGVFTSRVKQQISKEEIMIDGLLTKTGQITLLYKQKMLENNLTKTRYYEGKLDNSPDNDGLTVKGSISEDSGTDKHSLLNESFILQFIGGQYKVEYQSRAKGNINITAYLKFKDGIFSGISIDEKGYAVWAGVDSNNQVTLVQQYIDKENIAGSNSLEGSTFSFVGVMDKINNTIEGLVKNRDLDKDTKFLIRFMSKPKSV